MVFSGDVLIAWAGVLETDIKFSRTEKQIKGIQFTASADYTDGDRRVTVSALVGIRDNSGDFDDAYEGTVTVLVTAILKP